MRRTVTWLIWLAAALAGGPGSIPQTKPSGCSVKH